MGKITKEVKIGVAFILALFLVYFGINFLKGVNVFKPENSYVVVFENVAGMLQADPVTVNGLKIGQVHEMQLNPKGGKNVLVYVKMNKGVKIPKGSKLMLDAAMLGGATLLLEPTDSQEYYIPGDTLTGQRKSGMMDVAARITPQLENLLPKLDSIMSGVNRLVHSAALASSLDNVNTITGDFAQSTKEINKLLVSLNNDLPTISKSLVTTTTNFEQFSHQVKGIDLIATFNKVDSTMSNVQHLSSKLTSRDNSVGLLLNDRQLYDSLNVTLGNASMLMKDVKANPSRYINVKVF